MIYVFIGPPGCGKGTQAKLIKEALNIEHYSLGDMLRDEVKKQTPLGEKINTLISKGNYVDDEIVFALLEPKLKDDIIIDGYPRTLGQAILLENKLEEMHLKCRIFSFVIDNEKLLDRIRYRFTCKNCGTIYNKVTRVPQKENICDVCGSHEFEHRSDDTVSVLQQRLQNHDQQTKPIIDFYYEKGLVYNIDADQNIEDMKNTIMQTMHTE